MSKANARSTTIFALVADLDEAIVPLEANAALMKALSTASSVEPFALHALAENLDAQITRLRDIHFLMHDEKKRACADKLG